MKSYLYCQQIIKLKYEKDQSHHFWRYSIKIFLQLIVHFFQALLSLSVDLFLKLPSSNVSLNLFDQAFGDLHIVSSLWIEG